MNIIVDKINIFWGQKGSSSLFIKDKNLSLEQLRSACDKSIKFAYQIHSNIGYSIKDDFESFSKEGDFLITNQKRLKIGVQTADCVPIIFYDPCGVVGIAHAGWKGTLNNVAIKTATLMEEEFDCKKENILIWIGPSAKGCCYEVNGRFIDKLRPELERNTVTRSGNKIYFDLPRYNQLLLIESGIKKENINSVYNRCTICNTDFGSYRRDGENSALQISYVMLS